MGWRRRDRAKVLGDRDRLIAVERVGLAGVGLAEVVTPSGLVTADEEGGLAVSQHSRMFGQPAAWQTVCSSSLFTKFCSSRYCGTSFVRLLIHSCSFSIGV
jgi:hypothetical protein